MAYAFIDAAHQSSNSASTLTVVTANIGSNPTTGNMFWWVVNYTSGSVQTLTVSDTRLNTFIEIGNHFDSTVGDAFHWGYAKNITGGAADAFTATMGTLVADPAIYVAEYSGLDTSAPFTAGEFAVQDQSNPGTGASAVSSGNTPALSTQPAVLIGLSLQANNANALSAGTGFTSRGAFWDYLPGGDSGSSPFAFGEDKRLTATTAVASTFTSSSGNADNFTTIAAVFKEAGSGVSKNLTGQTATFTEGTVSRAVTYALSGQTATLTEGTITASTGGNVTLSLTGQTATFTEGTLAVNIGYSLNDGVPLTGQTATFAEGTQTPGVSYSLTGQSSTISEGTLGRNVTYSLTGQSATFTEGTITRALAYGVTGQTATFTEGSITVSAGGNVTTTLSGQTATFTEGVLVPAVSTSITGQSITSTEGTIGRAMAYGITALSATFAEGTVTKSQTGPVTISLTGLSATFAQGMLVATVGTGALVMPNLINENYYEALLVLQRAGIYVPKAVYAFTTSSISVAWRKSNGPPGLVVAQSIIPGTAVTAAIPIILTVSTFPFGSMIDSPPDWKQHL